MNTIVNQSDIDHLLQQDVVFAKIHSLFGPPPDWQRDEGFISLARIILEQQVSLQSANAHFIKLDSYLQEFTPTEILKLSDHEMRLCQISRQKSAYLRDLSTAITEQRINLENLRQLPEPEIRLQLKTIKGIGNWTTDIYMMFCLQAKDVFPFGDIAIINTMKELTSEITQEQIIARALLWKPYRSLAAYFLWHYYLRKRNR